MARTAEGKVKDVVTKIFKERGAYYFFPVTGGFGRSGVPDIVACYKGWFIGIECKAGKNQVTALQEKELQKIGTAGGITQIVNESSAPRVVDILNAIDNLSFVKG